MDSLIDQAIATNNEAVHLLSNGNIAGSFTGFQQAIATIRTFVVQLDDPVDAPPAVDESLGENTKSCFQDRPDGIADLQGDHFFVYNRAIRLSSNFSQGDRASTAHMVYCSIVFNLALASHQEASRTGLSAYLRRACGLYALAGHLIDETMTTNDSLGVLKCLSLNNCAELHYGQCNYEEGARCFDSMIQHLQLSGANLETFLDATEAEELWLNVEHRQAPALARAA